MTESGTATTAVDRSLSTDGDPVSPWARAWTGMPGWLRMVALAVAVSGFVVLAVWSAVAALDRPVYDRLADLHVYVGAVRAVRDGIPLYAYAAANGDPFTYPPFALLVFWPLGGLPEPVVQVLWTAASVAAVLVVAGPRRSRMVAGAIVLVTMLVSIGAVLPLSALGPVGMFLRDNVRALCAVAVCCGGVVSLWQAVPGRVRLLPGLMLVGRPRTVLVYCTIAAGLTAALLVSTRDRVVTAEAYGPGTASDAVWAGEVDNDPCMGMQLITGPDGKAQYVCSDAVGPALGGLQLNFSMGAIDGTDRGVVVVGEIGPEVTRLVYVPVQGAAPIELPLLPLLPAPATVSAADAAIPLPGQDTVPVLDRRSSTTRRFAVASNDATDALLLAYDADGRVVGQGGDKLRDR